MPDIKDLVLLLGLALMAAGIAGFDWRLAVIVIGVLSMGFGVCGYARKYGR